MPHRRGVEQWQLVGLITRRSLVRVQPPLPTKVKIAPAMPGLFYLVFKRMHRLDCSTRAPKWSAFLALAVLVTGVLAGCQSQPSVPDPISTNSAPASPTRDLEAAVAAKVMATLPVKPTPTLAPLASALSTPRPTPQMPSPTRTATPELGSGAYSNADSDLDTGSHGDAHPDANCFIDSNAHADPGA